MSHVTLNSSLRGNLLSLLNTQKLQNVTQLRLSSGLKVNSAIDNPSSYYTAQSLNNRSKDLSLLLDSMSQGIQTIKSSQTGLMTASSFLEQATSIINQSIETKAVPAKEWFSQQKNVSAVVTNQAELLNAINSGTKGDIVVYGKIDMTQSVTLKAGQNLVGVGYYGNFDTEVNKFSGLKFDFDKHGFVEGIVVNSANTTIADLSIKTVAAYDKNTFSIRLATQNNIIKNIDIQTDANKLKEYKNGNVNYYADGIAGGGFEFKGKNNIYIYTEQTLGQLSQGISNSNILMNNDTSLNISNNLSLARGVSGGSLTMNDKSILNISVYEWGIQSSIIQNNQSQVNINARYAIIYGNYTANDQAQLNIKALHAFFATLSAGVDYPLNVNINSKDVKIAVDATWLFRSSGSSNIFKLNMLEGAKIHYKNQIYEAKSPINRYLSSTENIPPELKVVGISDIKIPDTSKIKDIYFQEIKNNAFSDQYNQMLNQFDRVIKGSGYKGVNLLTGGDLTINFNENRSSNITVKGVDITTLALGLSQANWSSQSDIAKSLSEIASSLKQISAINEEFGNYFSIVSSRQDFTENLINVLTEGADKLTLADMNEESANMLALRTRQQLAINSLSLAAQASQSILKLF